MAITFFLGAPWRATVLHKGGGAAGAVFLGHGTEAGHGAKRAECQQRAAERARAAARGRHMASSVDDMISMLASSI